MSKNKKEAHAQSVDIESLVSDLVQELDYDMWKSLFDEECMEDPEAAAETREALCEIVRKHCS